MPFSVIEMFINHCPLKIIKRLQMQISSWGQVMSYFNMTLVSTLSYSWNVVAHSAHMLFCLCPGIYDVLVGNQYFRSLLLWINVCMEFHLQKYQKQIKGTNYIWRIYYLIKHSHTSFFHYFPSRKSWQRLNIGPGYVLQDISFICSKSNSNLCDH